MIVKTLVGWDEKPVQAITANGSRSSSAYIELLKTFPPRPISTEEELLATQEVID